MCKKIFLNVSKKCRPKNLGFTNKNKIKQNIVKYFSIEDHYYNKRLNSNVQKSRHNITFNEAFAKTKQAPNC